MEECQELIIEGAEITDSNEFGYFANDKKLADCGKEIAGAIVKLSSLSLKDFKGFSYTETTIESPF